MTPGTKRRIEPHHHYPKVSDPAAACRQVERNQYGEMTPLFRVRQHMGGVTLHRMKEGIFAALKSECPDMPNADIEKFAKKAAQWAFDRAIEIV